DDLVGLVSLVGHCGPPSWSKPYFKVDPFNGGGSLIDWTDEGAYERFVSDPTVPPTMAKGGAKGRPKFTPLSRIGRFQA
ncbi:hypothetical protein, partial [Chelativorans composti]